MPKTKPSWVCQSCGRPFTTKYSLMRHFKRFAEHAPPNLCDGADLKPVTIIVANEPVRTVQVVAAATSAAATSTTPHGHDHGTQRRTQWHDSSTAAVTSSSAQLAAPGSQSQILTPSSSDFESTPAPAGVHASLQHNLPINRQFPFLPTFLEDEQVLDIDTPMIPHQSSPSRASAEPQSPLSAHYSWMFAKDTTTAEHGGDLLSPLAPACNYGQVFSDEEEEKLQQVAKQQRKHQLQRSPVELADLDKSLLLGDEEATSPFTFLEKTSSWDPILPPPSTASSTSWDFFSHHHQRKTNNVSTVSRNGPANVSLDDLDFGFAF